MKLIVEESTASQQYIVEEDKKTGKKNHFIEGVFMQANVKNRNGRVYPLETLGKEVLRYNEEFVKRNRAFGELGHPESPIINLDRVSHLITELKQNRSDFVGKAKILDTPHGKIVKGLLDEGATLGVSSRAVGTLKKDGDTQYVGEDLILSTAADIVHDPSAPKAFVRGLMENREWLYENGVFQERELNNAIESIKRASSRKLEEQTLQVFSELFSKIG